MKSRLTADSWILTRPIAHRGLHGDSIPENSMSAYKAAIDGNYPIEMDIQMSKDGVLFCFHDDTATRVAGVDKYLRDMTAEEISALDIGGEGVPTFEEFLKLVNGQVPILIEIKQQKEKGVEQKTIDALKDYTGEFAIQSFDPFVMIKIKKLAPHVLRGQLGSSSTNKGIKWWIVETLPLNFISKPDFIHYNLWDMPLKKSTSNGLPTICYTIRTEEELEKVKTLGHNFVFENVYK